MTPPDSRVSHLEASTIADLDEHLVDADQAALATEHLAACSTCQARRTSLADVRGLLHDAGDVAPVPDDVAARLDAALLAAGPVTAEAAPTVTPLVGRARPAWSTRALQVAAVVVLLLGVSAVGYSALVGGSGSGSSSKTAASDATSAGGSAGADAAGSYPVTSSGRNYTAETLRAAVPGLIAGRTGRQSFGGSAESPQAESRLLGGAPLAACVANLAGGPVTPLAVDAAQYDGKPATIIVLPAQGDPASVDAYVVAPDCPTGTWIDLQRVARP
ncbi:MAG: hypothetical protein ACXV2G_02105 [Actinomycetes bacterium]